MKTVKCKGYYGPYTWEQTVYMDEEDDRDPVKVAIAQLRKDGHMTLGMASVGGKVVSITDTNEEE
ncbi:MAG: hypothetical protein IPM39_24965 [Chloroflexi bacterium]|nr:hypothetical protein [Chloroflexota bacterium]